MMNNIKLSTKIIAGFSVVLLLMIVVGYAGYNGMSGVVDRVQKADDVNRMVKIVQNARRAEKNFALRKDKKYVKDVQEEIDHLLSQATDTRAKFKKQNNIDQMDEVLTKANVYIEAFQGYVAFEDQKNALMEEMRASARDAIRELDMIRASQKLQLMGTLQNSGGGNLHDFDDKLTKADDANRMIKMFLEVRKNEKEVIISGEDKYLGAVEKGMSDILSLGRDLKSRFRDKNNIEQTDRALKALSQYHEHYEGFIEKIQQQKVSDQAMVEAARTVREVAEAARADQKAKMAAQMIRANLMIAVICVVAIIIGAALSTVLVVNLKKSMDYAVMIARHVADGDLTQDIKVTGRDEIGILLGAMKTMVTKLREMFTGIANGVETLSSSSTELSAISQQMAANSEQSAGNSANVAAASEQMSTNMNNVAAASEQASQNIGIVASAAEEMSSTIDEIAQNTEKGRAISSDAVSQTTSASRKMEQLGNAAKTVGQVTETITEISEQTNLLALNATIEAARAGEAGKGFAVVANEIKELAKQTAEATLQIREQIGAIQDSTLSTVGEIQQVTDTINHVNEVVGNIASSIEEQSIATKEIAGNVSQASQGIQEVTENVTQASSVSSNIAREIAEVNNSAQEITNASSQVHVSAEQLSDLSERLKVMVSAFKL